MDAAADARAPSNARYRLRILVVEDHEDSREMMAAVLRRTGDHTIALAESAHEGLEHLRMGYYDLVVTDIGLPGVSGLEMLDHAAREGLLGGSAVVVCSANYLHQREVVARGRRWLQKPIDMKTICEVVSSTTPAHPPRESGVELAIRVEGDEVLALANAATQRR